jgi:hypothetical protein
VSGRIQHSIEACDFSNTASVSFPDNALLDDRKDELYGFVPPARVITAEIAQHTDDKHLAAQSVRASLHHHHNPVKLCQSYTKLGELLMMGERKSCEGEGHGE